MFLSLTLKLKTLRLAEPKLNKGVTMFHHISLFIMLLTPVVAYVAGAVIFSFVESVRKSPALTKYNSIISYRNGL
jgi:hypothetical protein